MIYCWNFKFRQKLRKRNKQIRPNVLTMTLMRRQPPFVWTALASSSGVRSRGQRGTQPNTPPQPCTKHESHSQINITAILILPIVT